MTASAKEFETSRVRFIGRITASATHDLKNVLAIINENAGLLQDLSRMAEQGMLSPERLAAASAKIGEQVGRGDVILKNLNELAHSQDQDQTQVDLGRMADLAAGLMRRTMTSMEAGVQVEKPESCPGVTTAKLDLLRLLAFCLQAGAAMVGKNGLVRLQVVRQAPGFRVTCPAEICEDPDVRDLAASLNLGLSMDGELLAISFVSAEGRNEA